MKRLLGFSLLALSAALLPAKPHADTPAVNPAKQLYDTGILQTEKGQFGDARATMQSLVDRYPRDPLAIEARGAIDATLLFEEGQSRVKSGKYETARVAFETLIAVYPENPLARQAKSAIEAIAEKEKGSRPVVRSMEFRDVPAVPAEELRAALEAREVRLSVGKPCPAERRRAGQVGADRNPGGKGRGACAGGGADARRSPGFGGRHFHGGEVPRVCVAVSLAPGAGRLARAASQARSRLS